MNTQQTTEFLRSIKLFESLSEQQLESIVAHVQEVSFQKGDMLFEENSPREAFFVIVEGSVELYKTTPQGAETKFTIFHRGDFLGEGSWVPNSTHSTNAKALEPTKVIVVGKEALDRDADATLKVFSNIIQVVSQRMGYSNSMRIRMGQQYFSGNTRTEHDLLGERQVPAESYYGVQTLRATENFMISGVTLNFYPHIIRGLALVKAAAAEANHDLGLLSDEIYKAIEEACQELLDGKHYYNFVVDMIQGGAGTSTNMNANEVIANRALELMGHKKGEYQYCHPNNHVNCSQSTNDAYPTAMKLGVYMANRTLVDVLKRLSDAFSAKAKELGDVLKMGRTQLQDAVPMTLGQEFQGYADLLGGEVQSLEQAAEKLLEINMGATAIGTGINSTPGYADKCVAALAKRSGFKVHNAKNLIPATYDLGAFQSYSAALKQLAVKLSKVCNDLRLLSSGPRCGLNEINLPARQPGSTIMPGKVNPVIPEVVTMTCFKAIGNDVTVTLAAEAGQLELNVFEPVAVQSIFETVEMLKNGMKTLQYRCVEEITANRERCKDMVYNSIGIVTALNPYIGYERSTQVAKEALDTHASVYDLVLQKGWLSKEKLDDILSPEHMLRPREVK